MTNDDDDLTRPAFRYPSSGRRPERLNLSRDVNVPLQLARGWAAGTLGLPGDIEGLVRMLPGIKDETPVLPTSDFYREYLPGYDPKPAARAVSGLGSLAGGVGATKVAGALQRGAGTAARAAAPKVGEMAERYMQTAGMMPSVVKPKGGQWLSGSVEKMVEPLVPRTGAGNRKARETLAEMNAVYPPDVRATLSPESEAGIERAYEWLRPKVALQDWVDQKLTKYVKNEMGTPEDPLRALAEKEISHLPTETLLAEQAWAPSELWASRSMAGFPGEGFAARKFIQAGEPPEQLRGAQMAEGWENIADTVIGKPDRAAMLQYPELMKREPWLSKLAPDELVYGDRLAGMDGAGDATGFRHLMDELSNAINPESGLPRNLLLKPESLSKMTMPQAVQHVSKINKWREAQKVEADAARARNPATYTVKEYPEQKMQWVELKMPEPSMAGLKYEYLPEVDMWRIVDESGGVVSSGVTEREALGLLRRQERTASLEDALKYEGETMGHCVGGYCPDVIEGRSRIYSLRDKKGEPHVTIEVQPLGRSALSGADLNELEPGLFQKYLEQRYADDGIESMHEWLRTTRPDLASLQMITQIKGKGNRAPKEEYLPMVQDFVKSGDWGRVDDLANAGLVRVGDSYLTSAETNARVAPALKFLREDPALEPLRRAHAEEVNFSGAIPSPEYTAAQRRARVSVAENIPYNWRELESVLSDPSAYSPQLLGSVLGVVEQLRARNPGSFAGGGAVKKALKTLLKVDEPMDLSKREIFAPLQDASKQLPVEIPKNAPTVTEKTVEVQPGGVKGEKVTKSVIETPVSRRTVVKSAGAQAARRVLPQIGEAVQTAVPRLTAGEIFGGAKSLGDLYTTMVPLVRRVAPEELATMADRLGFTIDDMIGMAHEDILPAGDLAKEGAIRFEELFPQTAAKVLKKAGGGIAKAAKAAKQAAQAGKKEESLGQKMLQGFYRGYAGDYDAAKATQDAGAVFVTPQRAAGEFYANKRSAQTGLDPHLEMILADPFAGFAYGHSIPTGPSNQRVDFTRARQLSPTDVKSTTKLYAEGGPVAGNRMNEMVSNAMKNGMSEAEALRTYTPLFR